MDIKRMEHSKKRDGKREKTGFVIEAKNSDI